MQLGHRVESTRRRERSWRGWRRAGRGLAHAAGCVGRRTLLHHFGAQHDANALAVGEADIGQLVERRHGILKGSAEDVSVLAIYG